MSVAIIGSGFSGSLLAWILASRNVPVTLLDAQTHPRFAIGESSTPLADSILRQLGQKYDLQPLIDLSTYSSWKRTHPKLTCGKKRGFSYFHHDAKLAFHETRLGEKSLLVAASKTDANSDTHWYRSEVDEYFFKQAVLSGARPYSATSVVDIEPVGNRYRLLCGGNFTGEFMADLIVDASGHAAVSAKLFAKPNLRDRLKTQTAVRYGHFKHVRPWNQYLIENGLDTSIDPFNPDDAAQHHLGPFDENSGGWSWMLRFDNDVTSIGHCVPRGKHNRFDQTPAFRWMLQDAVQQHPTLEAPLIESDWVQSYYEPIVDQRIWLMPTAAITMDPLHSTGIAHALAGVQRLADMIITPDAFSPQTYSRIIHDEVTMLDQLISTAYDVMDHPQRFHAACMVYFAVAIDCEEAMQRGEPLTHLYGADNEALKAAVPLACRTLRDRSETRFEPIVQGLIADWNTAGLMNPVNQNRYAYTATKG